MKIRFLALAALAMLTIGAAAAFPASASSTMTELIFGPPAVSVDLHMTPALDADVLVASLLSPACMSDDEPPIGDPPADPSPSPAPSPDPAPQPGFCALDLVPK